MARPLSDLVNLPEPPVVLYEHPPLVLALCQLRFPRVLAVADPAFVAPFQTAVGASYPIAKEVHEARLQLTHQGSQLAEMGEAARRWQFADADDNWTLVLAQDFIALETRTYDRFSEFMERFRDALRALSSSVGPPTCTRLGLRYINEIRLRALEPEEVIRAELLGPLTESRLTKSARTIRAFQQLNFRYDEGQGITVTHGLMPEGTTVRPKDSAQAPPGPFYLLDFDAFAEPPGGAQPIDVAELCQRLENFNRVIYCLFRWCITDQYEATLGVREHVG